jgi:hypothetical protein
VCGDRATVAPLGGKPPRKGWTGARHTKSPTQSGRRPRSVEPHTWFTDASSTYHEIEFAGANRRHHAMQVARIVGPLAVQEDDDTVSSRPRPRQAGPPVAATRLADYFGASPLRDLGRPVVRAVLDDDEPVLNRIDNALQRVDETPDGRLFVETRYDHANRFAICCSRHFLIGTGGLLLLRDTGRGKG